VLLHLLVVLLVNVAREAVARAEDRLRREVQAFRRVAAALDAVVIGSQG
jgi:hypothetical protein